jgi:prepilin-type N-terminal cleavage/methylation domain-containing protein
MKRMNKEKGFTLIEILLVVVIIGIMLAVIVPRAWRANIDSKYGLIRQSCSELASFASLWTEQNIESQDETSTSRAVDYYGSLAGNGTVTVSGYINSIFIASTAANNWAIGGSGYVAVNGRLINGVAANPSMRVEAIVPPEKLPRNPFNGVSVFASPNYPTVTPVTGAIACAGNNDSASWVYFALLFQGTDSTSITNVGGGTVVGAGVFHAGMSGSLAGLRNGVFIARVN